MKPKFRFWPFAAVLIFLSLPPAGSVLTTIASAADPVPSARFRVVTYNVWYGFTKAAQRKQVWLRWMKQVNADVVSLQELNGYTDQQLREDAASWGHEHSVLLKQEGFPTGLTSRTPITQVKRLRDGFHHDLMRVETAGYTIYVVHLHPSNWEIRVRETQLLLDDVRSLPNGSRVILAGDFNTFSPLDADHYATLKDIEPFFARRDEKFKERNLRDGRLDDTPIQRLQAAGFVDQEARFREAFSGTFPTRIAKQGEHGDRRRLDYLFTDRQLSATVTKAWSVVDEDTHQLSDHYPVIMELRRATP